MMKSSRPSHVHRACLAVVVCLSLAAQGQVPNADLNHDLKVDWLDFAILSDQWLADLHPPVQIRWYGHTSFKLWQDDLILYLDPVNLPQPVADADLILVSHTHGDHYSASTIRALSSAHTQVIGATSVISQYHEGTALLPGETLEAAGIRITGVASYNTNKSNHPKSSNWLGFLIEIGGLRIYYAGDTDVTPEMEALEAIDVAIIPVGGTYTMTATEAATATHTFKPALSIPSHWGSNVGTLADVQRFVDQAYGRVVILAAGQKLNFKDLDPACDLLAHWPLDSIQGTLSPDLAGANTGTLSGDTSVISEGCIGQAIVFNGTDNDITTTFALTSLDQFTATAWIQTTTPARVILAQTPANGIDWLATDSQGHLKTDLGSGGRSGQPLISDTVITDGLWHHIALTYGSSQRQLYVDGVMAASAASASGPTPGPGLVIGSSSTRTAPWQGLIDDVRIYGCVLSAEDIQALAQ
ncbi:MAG: MBL fold metallo-hydrolase [Phycisphaerae bacterium]|nr:MBL fold metallo-hydrolase [Phycisphaerae bacterium]